MFAKVLSAAISGYEAIQITVEADNGKGLPSFEIVGLPDTSVSESRQRIKMAMLNSDCPTIKGHVVVNLSPADIRKEGSGFDLPIVISMLAADGQISSELTKDYMFVGELGLDGTIKHTKAILPIALLALKNKCKGLVLPKDNANEALVVPGLNVIPFNKLKDVIASFSGKASIVSDLPIKETTEVTNANGNLIEMASIKGQAIARRAVEVAAAGGHNIILAGPPGSGKTLLAKAIPTIMPPLEFEEAIEVTRIYSLKGLIPAGMGLIKQRPFREPHHTISDVALIGGGRIPAPGEVSLSHHGVLFLDELPEFKKSVLEVLREPLTSGCVSISRAASTCVFPAKFLLVAAMNPCPCGYLTDPVHECVCTASQQQKYKSKISGPLLDRIDIHVNVQRLTPEELASKPTGESSEIIRERVIKARKIQKSRNTFSNNYLNANIPGNHLEDICQLEPTAKTILINAAEKFALSARGYDKVLRIARTIADLAGSDKVCVSHIAEAIQYRTTDLFS